MATQESLFIGRGVLWQQARLKYFHLLAGNPDPHRTAAPFRRRR